MAIAPLIKKAVRLAGVEVARYRPLSARRARWLDATGVRTVLDIGANRGQYASELRASGFDGLIHSFEPLPHVFGMLAQAARGDTLWICHNVGLAEKDDERVLNVANQDASSSFLGFDSELARGAPRTVRAGSERVPVRRLDAIELELRAPLMLKLDVQGYEDRVLAGARALLSDTVLIECELALAHLYEGQPSFGRMVGLLDSSGFGLVDCEPNFRDVDDGRVLSVDGVFVRQRVEERAN